MKLLKQLAKMTDFEKRGTLASLRFWRNRHLTNSAKVYVMMPDSRRVVPKDPALFGTCFLLPEALPDVQVRRFYAFASLADRRQFMATNPTAVRCPNPDPGCPLPEE